MHGIKLKHYTKESMSLKKLKTKYREGCSKSLEGSVSKSEEKKKEDWLKGNGSVHLDRFRVEPHRLHWYKNELAGFFISSPHFLSLKQIALPSL